MKPIFEHFQRPAASGWVIRILSVLISLCFAVTAALASERAGPLPKQSAFGVYQGYSEQAYDSYVRESQYVPVRDGTRLAVDLYFPANNGHKAAGKFPVLLWFTGYGRQVLDMSRKQLGGKEEPSFARHLLEHGYIIIAVDMRGVGASFGKPLSIKNIDQEQKIQGIDGYDIIEWSARQAWSTGHAGLFGASWMGLIQPIIGATAPPSLKAMFPMVHYFVYDIQAQSPAITRYVDNVAKMNGHRGTKDVAGFGAGMDDGIRPVDGPSGAKVLQRVLKERQRHEKLSLTDEDIFRRWANPLPAFGKDAPRLRVPMYSWQGIYDFQPHASLLWHANTEHAPVKAVVGPWTHGPDEPNDAKGDAQKALYRTESLRWFDYWLKGIDNRVMDGPSIRYAVIGQHADPETWLRETDEWAWIETDQWPAAAVERQRFYLGAEGSLQNSKPSKEGSVAFTVDYSATSGGSGRAADGAGAGPIHFPELTELNAKGLVFTSSTLETDLALAGAPIIQLNMRSTAPTGRVHVFLEKVLADGSSIYITDGMTLASHRTLGEPVFDNFGLPHLKRDPEAIKAAAPFNAGIAMIKIPLTHAGIVFEQGSKIRIAITGADAGAYLQTAIDPAPEYTVYTGGQHESWISLPLVKDTSDLSFEKWAGE